MVALGRSVKRGKKRNLLSLIGSLQHASKAVRQGHSFLRRLINLSTAVQHLDHFVRLNVSARSDSGGLHLPQNGTAHQCLCGLRGTTHKYQSHQMHLAHDGGVEPSREVNGYTITGP